MVKQDLTASASEGNGVSELLKVNGKRPSETSNEEVKKRVKTKSLYRQPTVNELNRLQETENLFNSNLFRLQIEEILQEIKIKEKTLKKFQTWFDELRKHLDSIPEDGTEYDLTESTLFKKLKVKSPVGGEISKTKCVFKFKKFKKIDIVGSYALGCPINSKLRVDLQICVPAETYTKNDSINYRYHKKRATYLAYIASHLNKLDTIEDLKYMFLNGCETKPILELKPNGKLGSHLSVRINLTCEAEAYKLQRLSPQRNNLRESWLLSVKEIDEIGPASPYYNSSILCDLTDTANQEFLKQQLVDKENLKQAVVLLKIWLRQRKLEVSGHIVNMFIAYLVQNKRINNIMSSYQIIRNVWIALKTSEWDTKGITLNKESNTTPITEFLQYFPIVFLDTTGYYNLCWNMCKGTYNALRRESDLAVDLLDSTSGNSFILLFMTPVQPLTQFDHIIRFKNLPQLKASVVGKASRQHRLNYGLDTLALTTDELYRLLTKGLGDRVDLILQLVDADYSWPVKKNIDKVKDGYKEDLSFGLVLNPQRAFNIVEKGPSANLPEAELFRLFWGDKCELRRFQDGAILETCVWEGDGYIQRRTVTKQIVDYLLFLKFGVPPSDVFHVSSQLDTLLTRKRFASDLTACCEETSLAATRHFEELRRDLRGLTELPLDLAAIYGVSPVFSYSDPLPPLPTRPVNNPWRRGHACLVKNYAGKDGLPRLPEYTPVCKAIVELGHSGKWPGEIEAFRCLKAAFHLQISDRLKHQYSLPSQANPTHVDVLKNGLVFRLEIAHPKEITLLRRDVQNGVVKFREGEESLALQRDTVLMPRLRGALHGLHQKHPAFGPTACLLKRWLCSHLLSSPHFPHVVAELVTAAVYLRPAPPSTPSAGLFRVWALLANTDWATEMLVLDFHQDMKREEITSLERKFTEDRASHASLYIVTSYDGEQPGVFSGEGPDKLVLNRVQALATSALNYVEEALLRDMKDNILGVFVPSLSGYSALIYLQPSLVPYHSERVDRPPMVNSLPEAPGDDVIPVVQFHVVEKYLQELRSAFNDFALFFHDSYGGDVIAVLWKPDVKDFKEFQLSNANALKPDTIKGETKYRINTEALIEDFRIMGSGLVRDITVLT